MLAIASGKPIRNEFLSYGQQWIFEEDIEAVTRTLQSAMITQGPMIEAFEEKIAEYVGVSYAVAFSSGTAALHAAYYAAGLSQGDEMITSPITFVATSNAALYVGATPQFADIDSRTINLDPKKAESCVTERTKAIVPVDFAGQPADMTAFREICDQHDIVFISDAAHSLGATYQGKRVGSHADMTMFSFHPVKPITAAEGGVIVTNHAEYAEKLRLFRSHGVTRANLSKEEGPWYYEMVDLGYNYRMTDIQASLALSQMKRLDYFIARRREIAETYTKAFSKMEGIIPPYESPECESGWHLYVLRLQLEKFKVGRRQIFDALRAENIGVHVHYIPVYTQPYYEQLGYEKGICPTAEQYYEEAITLPIFPKMTDKDVEDVIRAVEKVVEAYLVS